MDRIGFSLTGVLDREKGAGGKRFQNLVDIFRGVSFDDWLQLTMEVINPFLNLAAQRVDQLWISVLVSVDSP